LFYTITNLQVATTQQQPPFYSYYTGQWRILLMQFYCPHAPADGNQCIQTREIMLQFSLSVIYTLSIYCYFTPLVAKKIIRQYTVLLCFYHDDPWNNRYQ